MADSHSKKAIYAAMAANIAIGIAKFVGAAISGSSAMFSEGIHSVVDSVNEVLLLYGIKRSKTAPTDKHPLGYGQELYFWSLIVAVLIFALGGGVSIYEGIEGLQNPELARSPLVSYVVLGMAAIFEGAALAVSIREFNRRRSPSDEGLWSALRQSKDPSSFVVIFEDFAALVGLIIAFIGVFASQQTGNELYDSLASIIIGLVLFGVAIVLVAETKGLLVGESASPAVRASIEAIVTADTAVNKAELPITFHLGPNDVLLALNIEFCDELAADEIEIATRRIESNIRAAHAEVKQIFIEASSVSVTKT